MNIFTVKNLIYGFFIKEFYTEKLYKTNFLLKTVSVIFQILIFYFLCTKIDPDYFYFLKKEIKGFQTQEPRFITTPAKRFSEVEKWYIKEKRSWK